MVQIMYKYHLNDVEWGEFFIGGSDGIFDVRATKSGIDKNKLNVKNGDIPYITRSEVDNGINLFITDEQNPKYKKDKGNVITIGLDTQTLFYQKNEFYTGQNIQVLSNEKLNKSTAMFIIPLIKIQMRKFNWGGNGATLTRLNRTKIMLPIEDNNNPNWHFMEEYIKERENKQKSDLKEYYKNRLLDMVICPEVLKDVEWGEFFVSDIFNIVQRGKRLTKANQIDGETPYISSTSLNNGVDNFIGNSEGIRKSSNDLTLANSGSVGACFYQNYEYIASDHVTSLTLANGSAMIYKFLSIVLSRLEEKYSFNREINDTRIKREKLILPIDKNGNPNWTYMENFIKNIEQKKIKEILKYLDQYIYIYIMYNHFAEAEWREFFVEDVTEILSGRDIYERERVEGKIPYITATANNNGIGYFVSNTNSTKEARCISVNRNGSVGYSFYHPYEALYGNDTRKLRPIIDNKYISMFISSAITRQKDKYGYGYKMGTGRLKRQKIVLPVDKKDTINYMVIENYMKAKEMKQIIDLLKDI